MLGHHSASARDAFMRDPEPAELGLRFGVGRRGRCLWFLVRHEYFPRTGGLRHLRRCSCSKSYINTEREERVQEENLCPDSVALPLS